VSAAGTQDGAGLARQVLAAYPDFRAAMARRLADPPREARLVGWAFLAGLIGFVAGLPSVGPQAATLDTPDAMTAVLAGRLFAALFVFPLMLYLVAALSHLVARAFGGRGSFGSARLALFWAVIAALPILVASGVATALLRLAGGGMAAALAGLVSTLSALAFAWIWGASLAEAEGFRRTVPAVAGIVALPLLLSAYSLIYLP
jgi:hypothetical protein